MKKQNDFFKKMLANIESFKPQSLLRKSKNKTFELRENKFLTTNLSGGVGALIIRAILYKMGINERRLFKWRLENKYIQYRVLTHFNPGCMADTISLSKLLNAQEGVSKIKQLFDKGFFLKATLGHGSFINGAFDRTAEFDDIQSSGLINKEINEKWILQKKMDFREEFRIHTFSRDIIYGATLKIKGLDSLDNFEAEEFVKNILYNLPDSILQGSMMGWDIGRTNDNKYYVIETNLTGFHPEYSRGFQTSGHVEEVIDGPIICAWLNNYFKRKYGISISSVESTLFLKFQFYQEFLFYVSIFEKESFEFIWDKTNEKPLSIIIYLEDENSTFLIRLTAYFQRANFNALFYFIIKENLLLAPSYIYNKNKNSKVKIFNENDLFTEDQFQLVKQFAPQRRKQLCYHHVQKLINQDSYVVI